MIFSSVLFFSAVMYGDTRCAVAAHDTFALSSIEREALQTTFAQVHDFVHAARKNGWSDEKIVQELVNCQVEHAYATPAEDAEIKNKKRYIKFLVGAVVVLGVAGGAYWVYTVIQKKRKGKEEALEETKKSDAEKLEQVRRQAEDVQRDRETLEREKAALEARQHGLEEAGQRLDVRSRELDAQTGQLREQKEVLEKQHSQLSAEEKKRLEAIMKRTLQLQGIEEGMAREREDLTKQHDELREQETRLEQRETALQVEGAKIQKNKEALDDFVATTRETVGMQNEDLSASCFAAAQRFETRKREFERERQALQEREAVLHELEEELQKRQSVINGVHTRLTEREAAVEQKEKEIAELALDKIQLPKELQKNQKADAEWQRLKRSIAVEKAEILKDRVALELEKKEFSGYQQEFEALVSQLDEREKKVRAKEVEFSVVVPQVSKTLGAMAGALEKQAEVADLEKEIASKSWGSSCLQFLGGGSTTDAQTLQQENAELRKIIAENEAKRQTEEEWVNQMKKELVTTGYIDPQADEGGEGPAEQPV